MWALRDDGFDVEAVLSGRDRSVRGRLLRVVGQVAEPCYATAMRARNAAYDRGWRQVHRLDRRVISIGNLTTGGTGKTPMVIDIVQRLCARGRRPAVLMRGYGAAAAGEPNDEARLMQAALGDAVPLGVGADRVAAAERVLAEHGEVDVFVLDDGFQHRRVARNVDIVLVDATNPLGYGHVLPRGLLREPAEALRRADAVFVTRAERLGGIAAANELEQLVQRYHGKPPAAWFAHRWRRVVDAAGQTVAEPPSFVAGRGQAERAQVFVFCGLAQPRSLVEEAMRWFDVVGVRRFADHHRYTAEELAELRAAAEEAGATALLTSEKDWVKLAELGGEGAPIWRPQLTLECMQGEEAVEELLGNL